MWVKRSVERAREVIDNAEPELIQAVEQGKIAVSVAAGLATASEAIQTPSRRRARARPCPREAGGPSRSRVRAGRRSSWPGRPSDTASSTPTRRGGSRSIARIPARGGRLKPTIPPCRRKTLAALDVPSIAADDCVLFLWTTAPTMPEALTS